MLHCEFADKVCNKFWDIFGMKVCKPKSVVSWLSEALEGGYLKGKAKVLWQNITRAIIWHLWKERNSRIFAGKKLENIC